LLEPSVIDAVGGKAETTLTLRMANVKVPFWRNIAPFGQPAVYQCTMTSMNLRQYSWPVPGAVVSGFPGPTFRLRKAASPQAIGDSLTVHLVNELPIAPNDQCSVGCDCSNPNSKPRCCTAPDVFPACFHGDNNTNLHFHGTHVSPQPPQDYVLLELRPKGASTDSMGTHDHRLVRAGTYDYVVDPFRFRQPEERTGITRAAWVDGSGSAVSQRARSYLGSSTTISRVVRHEARSTFSFCAHSRVEQFRDRQHGDDAAADQRTIAIDRHVSPEIRRLRFLSAAIRPMARSASIGTGHRTMRSTSGRLHSVASVRSNETDRQPMLDRAEHRSRRAIAPTFLKAPTAEGTYDVTYIHKYRRLVRGATRISSRAGRSLRGAEPRCSHPRHGVCEPSRVRDVLSAGG
jgi:hypothetical protein